MIKGLIIGTIFGLFCGFVIFGFRILPEVIVRMGTLEVDNYHDPTLLEQAISKGLDAKDSYDIILRSERTGLFEISFNITGKATPYYFLEGIDSR